MTSVTTNMSVSAFTRSRRYLCVLYFHETNMVAHGVMFGSDSICQSHEVIAKYRAKLGVQINVNRNDHARLRSSSQTSSSSNARMS